MREIEVKILEVNRPELEKKLLSLGAEKIFEGTISDVYFDTNDKTKLLRLRNENDKTIFTLKNKILADGVKEAEETEVEVKDYETMKKIVESLGYSVYLELIKKRISYKLNGARFEFDNYLDNWEHVPEFMEIEAKNKEEIIKNAKLLGFEERDLKPWSGKEVERHYREKNESRIILSGNIIINATKEIYLLWRTKHSHYETPGGKIKPEECKNFSNPTIEELKNAAKRELIEEVENIEIISMEYFDKIKFTIPDGRKAIAYKFITKIIGTPTPAEDIFDKEKSKWIKIEDVEGNLLSPDLKIIFPKFKEYLKRN